MGSALTWHHMAMWWLQLNTGRSLLLIVLYVYQLLLYETCTLQGSLSLYDFETGARCSRRRAGGSMDRSLPFSSERRRISIEE